MREYHLLEKGMDDHLVGEKKFTGIRLKEAPSPRQGKKGFFQKSTAPTAPGASIKADNRLSAEARTPRQITVQKHTRERS